MRGVCFPDFEPPEPARKRSSGLTTRSVPHRFCVRGCRASGEAEGIWITAIPNRYMVPSLTSFSPYQASARSRYVVDRWMLKRSMAGGNGSPQFLACCNDSAPLQLQRLSTLFGDS